MVKSDFKYWTSSVLLTAILGASLGGMGSYWYFFWKNRDMCPCAPQGIEGGEGLEDAVAEPYSDVIMRKRVISFSLSGGMLGVAVSLLLITPKIRKFNNALKEIELSGELPGDDTD
ncbi:MAG: hypothetical protein JXR91_05465 [Deltaproteobacteria bacterium]|nr:hypothetical protein [Deltaproteobacteria bacterium]